jgi:high-affinity iron transporter
MASGSAIGLIGVGFTAIYREGFETALFYEVLFNMSARVEVYVLLGLLAGTVVLAVVAWMILRMGRRLPIKTFMSVAVTIIILLSVAFAGKAVQQLQESGLIPATSLIGVVPRLPHSLADFTGIHPTVETLAAQAILSLIYISGAVIMRLKQRGRYNVPSAINQPVNTTALNRK